MHEPGLNGIVLTDRQECLTCGSGAVWWRSAAIGPRSQTGAGPEDYVAWELVTYWAFLPRIQLGADPGEGHRLTGRAAGQVSQGTAAWLAVR
jgi:hypothetical protein